MKTLYVTDLDGTLLNSSDRISDFSRTTINQLVEAGMCFTYATARSLVSASVVTKGLSANIPVIAYNGTFIFHPSTQEILASVSFTPEEIAAVIAAMRKYQISPLVYSFLSPEETGKRATPCISSQAERQEASFSNKVEKVSWVTSRENEGIRRYLSLRQGDRRLRPLADESGLYDGTPFYFTCIGEREQLLALYKQFHNHPSYTCTLQQELYRPEYWCEIMPRKATKAEAMQKLNELLACDRIVSFGDAINDIPMFQASDECYAVANAVEELKALASGVIASNDADGVAKWLLNNTKYGKNQQKRT